jgi:predicted DNA-binding transcriptional regulator AlpA
MSVDRILRRSEVAVRCGFSESTLQRQVKSGIFPQPQRLSPGVIGWRSSTVRTWLRSRPPTTKLEEIERDDEPRESGRMVGSRTTRR